MSDQSKLGIGQIIKTEQHRDAIHVAVAPVKADMMLKPGDHVGFTVDGEATRHAKQLIGIVDPFLKQAVGAGDTFWMFLYPGSITSLRHEWTHPQMPVVYPPSISARDPECESKRWLEEFATKVGYTYEDLIEKMTEVLKHDGGCVGDDDTSDRFNDSKMELLFHAARVTGIPASSPDNVYFSCAC
jgi:hypothetical protein